MSSAVPGTFEFVRSLPPLVASEISRQLMTLPISGELIHKLRALDLDPDDYTPEIVIAIAAICKKHFKHL